MGKENIFETKNTKIFYKESIPQNNLNPLTLICIHGFPLDSSMWDNLTERLKEKYHVVSYDIRSLGNSSLSKYPYTFEYLVNDLKELIDHLNLEKAVLLGLSIGGYIALRAMQVFPEKIHALILSNTQPGNDQTGPLLGRYKNMEVILNEGKETFAENFLKNALSEDTIINNKNLVINLKSKITNQKTEGLLSSLVALATRTSAEDVLDEISCPVLVIAGQNDNLTPVDVMKKMSEKIYGSEFKIISSAGHFSPVENPGEYADVVSGFLEKI